MIRIYKKGEDLSPVFSRSQLDNVIVLKTVREILEDVREHGDAALKEYSLRFDRVDLNEVGIEVGEEEFEEAYRNVSEEMLTTLRSAIKNVLEYHKAHKTSDKIVSENGRTTGILVRPAERAGVYVPGGTAPYPSSVLMTVLPAKAAGVKEVVMCSPNVKSPLTLVAAKECGVDTVYRIGGAQAIGAMAYGTESVKKVDVIAGPGNVYVTLAKKEVFGKVKIDMIAGPSEILVIADESANARIVAADLLSQAEHDRLSASVLITDSERLAESVEAEIEKQLKELPREAIARESIETNGAVILVSYFKEAAEIANRIAPEHLELVLRNPSEILPLIRNAGAVFAGHWSPEPLGDYFAGPSHVLPTSGTARHFEVLNSDTFLRKMSYIEYTEDALRSVKDDVMRLADAEGFTAHRESVKKRFEGETK